MPSPPDCIATIPRSILLEARIVTVADIFDAMTSVRPYRAPLAVDFVLDKLQAMAGTLSDADVVNACRHCVLTGLT